MYKTLSPEIEHQIITDRNNNIKNPYAFKNENVIRRYKETAPSNIIRPPFVKDVEKILHNNYYNRYSDKTQVISFVKNDDVSRRALHVQLVSRTARTIGLALGLNLDLIEAISLGHDIGHTPFGHTGERYLNEIYHANTGKYFNHNVHSARVLDKLICRNISLQVLDGVLCHNGEMEQGHYEPTKLNNFDELDKRINDCYTDKSANSKQIPSTLEACVMRISDIIAYLGKDRQDAQKIGLVTNNDIFSNKEIGSTNAEIINNITVSIIEHSYGKPYISMDKEVFEALSQAKKENYEKIYKSEDINTNFNSVIKPMFEKLYNTLLHQAKHLDQNSILYKYHINFLKEANAYTSYFNKSSQSTNTFIDNYLSNSPDDIVVDFIASMTDDYFIDLYNYIFPNDKAEIKYIGYFDTLG